MVRTSRLVTLAVFHELMSSSKLAQSALHDSLTLSSAQKTYARLSTREMSHMPIGPYVLAAATGSAHHASRATSNAAWSTKA